MSERVVREGYAGTGPGAITPDGCAVELYSRLAVNDEPDIVAAAVPAGSSILELGCGVGRVTHPLIERGFDVTAVDESPQMLERVRGARTVCGPIESLDLGDETFDVVMLASFLVHSGDDRVRDGLLRTCRRYVRDGGSVLFQREGEDYHDVPRERVHPAGYTTRILSSEPVGDGVESVRAEYEFADARWTQTFLSRPMSKERFEGHLDAAGLRVERYLTEDGIWVLAVPK
ncbi:MULTISPECIES: bifunctional 2-polyprenyl-6-hydroxyphenol methylase/3-demethylubiquinol 3-O-methyltransferase UbiG [unclassified Streptomyces]|uniref:class I SAM-dependent methyltransferase n=1 Tax=unclassified Streptomyces TaxID=2593676 RepID=UPI00225C0DDA|nr:MULTISPECIES: class I SAM-dependent methyltransferase [unclassified Streptomyces]MCX5139564.1 class I SAM-dependent methyltransferase [Streptomyces sp. NBC_00338]WRZ64236.1 class I SAM-dependent methyltransferase [Streptomyces sp. NBC_01257]